MILEDKHAIRVQNFHDLLAPADDPALALSSYGEKARRAALLNSLVQIPGKHFPQEDQAALIASHIAGLVSTVSAATDELPGSLADR